MCPLSNRRSSTFSMSKLGYLASRAPRAMFSRSRKTAMVASEDLVVIGCESTRLEPVVVEADADAFGIGTIRYHFVPQPAFEQHQFTGGGRKGAPGAALALGRGLARRGG